MSAHWLVLGSALALYAALSFPSAAEGPIRSIGALVSLVPLGLLVLWSFMAARSARGKNWRLWRTLGLAGAFLLVGEGYAAIYEAAIDVAGAPSPGLHDIGYFLGYLAFVPVVLLATESFEVVGLRTARNILDVFTVMVWVSITVFVLVVGPLAEALGTTPAAASWDVLDLVVDIGFAVYLLAFKRSRWSASHVFLLSMFVGLAVADAAHVAVVASGAVPFADWQPAAVDLLFMAAYGLGAAAPLSAMRSRVTNEQPVVHARGGLRPELDLPYWPGLVAQLLALTTIPLLLVALARMEGSPSARLFLASGSALLVALIVVRSALVSYENQRLLAQNLVDPLSSLGNLRHYREQVAAQCQRVERSGSPLSVALLDIEDLDSVNAEFGHTAGDAVIRAIADELRQQSDSGDVPCRVGGDLFGWIMPGVGPVEAYAAVTRFQVAVAPVGRDAGVQAIRLTGGVVGVDADCCTAAELDRRARAALYWAKRHRRGEAVVFDSEKVDVMDAESHVVQVRERSHTTLLEVLAAAVDARDPYTQSHSSNVAQLAAGFAGHLSMDGDTIALLRSAAQLHDVGKIGVPDAILRKPSSLTALEFEAIKQHPELGCSILEASERSEMLPWIRSHHEQWDGSGYPDGLIGEHIPYEARILALCDSFDAMTSNRPYRRGRALDDALDEIRRCAGAQFDPELAESFVDYLLTDKTRAPQ